MKRVLTSRTHRKWLRDSSRVYGLYSENSRYSRCNEWLKVRHFLPQLCLRLVLSFCKSFHSSAAYSLQYRQAGLNDLSSHCQFRSTVGHWTIFIIDLSVLLPVRFWYGSFCLVCCCHYTCMGTYSLPTSLQDGRATGSPIESSVAEDGLNTPPQCHMSWMILEGAFSVKGVLFFMKSKPGKSGPCHNNKINACIFYEK